MQPSPRPCWVPDGSGPIALACAWWLQAQARPLGAIGLRALTVHAGVAEPTLRMAAYSLSRVWRLCSVGSPSALTILPQAQSPNTWGARPLDLVGLQARVWWVLRADWLRS